MKEWINEENKNNNLDLIDVISMALIGENLSKKMNGVAVRMFIYLWIEDFTGGLMHSFLYKMYDVKVM